MFNDLMENIEWFFNLHDKNKDGYLTKDEVLTLSESLLVSILEIRGCKMLTERLSLSSDTRLATPTWVLSVDLCRMHLSMVMHFFHDQRAQTLKMIHHRWSRISLISTSRRRFSLFIC